MKTIEGRITFIEEVLGSSPSDKEIYRSYIGSKAPDAQTIEEEVAAVGTDAAAEKKMTVFSYDEDGNPFLYDYQLKGFLKGAALALQDIPGMEATKLSTYAITSKLDNLIFPNPRKIMFNMPEGSEVGLCERPLRAKTMQGPRVALASSQTVPAGSTIDFEITVLAEFSNPKTKKKKVKKQNDDGEIVEETVEVTSGGVDYIKLIRECLDYGKYNGIGQWHNSGKGRFTWEELRCY